MTSGQGDGGAIRITHAEAMSRHVEDLLQRQRSLRGDPNVKGEHKGPWYLRNWVVLSLAGTLGAVLAWAAIEPFFDDVPYVQGTVASVSPEPREWGEDDAKTFVQGSFLLEVPGQPRVTVWVPAGVQAVSRSADVRFLDLEELKVGQVVGVYAEYVEVRGEGFGLARFIEPSLDGPVKAGPSLRQRNRRSLAAGLLLFAVVAAGVGLFVGAADGVVCRQPRRALLAGAVGLGVGALGGFLSSVGANVIYTPFTILATRWMQDGHMGALGFLFQILGRSLAWAMAGMAMGLGQGIALRSKRLLLFGFLGGVVGGVLGGLLFDPIDMIVLGTDKPSAHWSRGIGLGVIGATVGLMIGVVELMARDAWLKMTEGSLAGKEFLLFKDVMRIGSASRSDIYLFGDPQVDEHHATLRAVGDEYEIENLGRKAPVLVNGRPIDRSRLRHGDQIALGRTSFVFQRRQG